MSERDLSEQLRAWTDAVDPVTPDEVRKRAEGGPHPRARRPHRGLLLAAAAVIVVAAVLGFDAIRDDDGPRVRTIDSPQTSTTPPTVRSTTTAPLTMPTLPGSSGVPARWVGLDSQFRLVARSSALDPGEVVLATFDDPGDFGGEGKEPVAAGTFGDSVAVSPDGRTVYFDTCCEPAPGLVYRVPIEGGEPEEVTTGSYPAVSPDGTKLAVVELQWLKIVDLETGESTVFPHADNDPIVALARPVWSPDGTAIAIEEYDEDIDQGDLMMVELDGQQDNLQAAATLASADADGTPMHAVWVDDRTLSYVRQRWNDEGDPAAPAYLETVDRYDGEPRRVRDLPQAVRGQDGSPGGEVVLVTFVDGSVTTDLPPASEGTPGFEAVVLSAGTSYFAAAW